MRKFGDAIETSVGHVDMPCCFVYRNEQDILLGIYKIKRLEAFKMWPLANANVTL